MSDYAKSGTARGHQRYRCRSCGAHFTDTPLRGKPPAMKALALLLHGMGNMSFNGIGRLLGVSDVAVLKWVRAEAMALPEPEVAATAVTVEVDEMWHYLRKVCVFVEAVGSLLAPPPPKLESSDASALVHLGDSLLQGDRSAAAVRVSRPRAPSLPPGVTWTQAQQSAVNTLTIVSPTVVWQRRC